MFDSMAHYSVFNVEVQGEEVEEYIEGTCRARWHNSSSAFTRGFWNPIKGRSTSSRRLKPRIRIICLDEMNYSNVYPENRLRTKTPSPSIEPLRSHQKISSKSLLKKDGLLCSFARIFLSLTGPLVVSMFCQLSSQGRLLQIVFVCLADVEDFPDKLLEIG